MRRSAILILAFLAVCMGCRASDPMRVPARVLRNVDFDYESTWEASMNAVQDSFPFIKDGNKDDMRVTSHYKLDLNTPITSPYEYATRAFLTIVPRESAERHTTYDIEVHVGKYWRARRGMRDDEEDWTLIRWLPESEDKIIQAFKEHTRMEQRIRQDHDSFNRRK
jgi:hypothetical protein